eukprot:TRINITY_DN41875_c0_g1_i1.p1 TRINITY_DN41875_c0_g1~~TRINITY_DN41875_c0_g1_i1.p1  ORF type:complete len:407 (-),score=109.57 TRINITY_DN41875_c0_g1_i1:269-1489(-)
MAFVAEADDGHDGSWIFTLEALSRTRADAYEMAKQTLRHSAAGLPNGLRVAPEPLSLEENVCLASFYARMLPELCTHCQAPSEVRWTAIVFYQRFFAVRTAMEFDPLAVMFACVFVACKVEECHDITLDKVLEAAGFGGDDTLKAKVGAMELPLLEAIRFILLVEPKPEFALEMLIGELRGRLPALHAKDDLLNDVLTRAEELLLEMVMRTDAALRWPASTLIAAALSDALETKFQGASGGGQKCDSAATLASAAIGELDAFLCGSLAKDSEVGSAAWSNMQHLIEEVRDELREIAAAVAREGQTLLARPAEDANLREVAKAARRCNKAFERLRKEDGELHEANRKERKRRWSEIKPIAGGRQAASAVAEARVAEINRLAAEMHTQGSDAFVLHRLQEDDSAEDDP